MEVQLTAGVPVRVLLSSRTSRFTLRDIAYEFKTIEELFLEDALRMRAEGKQYYWVYARLVDPATGQELPDYDVIIDCLPLKSLIEVLSGTETRLQCTNITTSLRDDSRAHSEYYDITAPWFEELPFSVKNLDRFKVSSKLIYIDEFTEVDGDETLFATLVFLSKSRQLTCAKRIHEKAFTVESKYIHWKFEKYYSPSLPCYMEEKRRICAKLRKHERLLLEQPDRYFKLKIPKSPSRSELTLSLEGAVFTQGAVTHIGKVSQGNVYLVKGEASMVEINPAFVPSQEDKFELEITSNVDCKLWID